MLPVESTATAGRATFKVHPNGYTNDMDLKNRSSHINLKFNYVL